MFAKQTTCCFCNLSLYLDATTWSMLFQRKKNKATDTLNLKYHLEGKTQTHRAAVYHLTSAGQSRTGIHRLSVRAQCKEQYSACVYCLIGSNRTHDTERAPVVSVWAQLDVFPHFRAVLFIWLNDSLTCAERWAVVNVHNKCAALLWG